MRASDSKPGEPQHLGIHDAVQVTGTVEIEGRPVRVAFGYDPNDADIQINRARQGMDLDRDGVADLAYSSPELDRGLDDTPVFRVRDLYLSFAKVDLKKLRFTMRTREPSDYVRIELVRGTPVPDFQFVDLTGKKRRISDFRGQYVLLDFWGSWCAPCVEGLPRLQALYSKYKGQGLEILGMTRDESESAAKRSWPRTAASG
jgi:thiol-disulfide isomerase/thioredoxin